MRVLDRFDKDKVILLFVAIGMVMAGLEVRQLHHDVLRDNWEGWIPVVYTAAATVTTLLALAGTRALRMLAAFVFVVGIPVGVIGFYEHTEFELRPIMRLFTASAVTARAQDGDDDDDAPRAPSGGGGIGGPPPLAPLALSGLSAIGACVLLMRRRSEDEPEVA